MRYLTITVVNDGSTDRTGGNCRKLCKLVPGDCDSSA